MKTNLGKYFVNVFLFFIIAIVQTSYGNKGSWEQKDNKGNTIVFEWYQFNGDTIEYYNKIKEFAEVRTAALESHVMYAAQKLIDNPEIFKSIEDDAEREGYARVCQWMKDGLSVAKHREQEIAADCDKKIKELEFKPENQTPASARFIVVAKDLNGNTLGIAIFIERGLGCMYLSVVGVRPSARRLGIGAALTLSVLKLSPKTTSIILKTLEDNTAFYEKIGFKLYEEKPFALRFRYTVPQEQEL